MSILFNRAFISAIFEVGTCIGGFILTAGDSYPVDSRFVACSGHGWIGSPQP